MKKRNQKTVIIVGAGISGMSAGIYGQQNGFNTILLEMNPRVGGLCTGWYREGNYIDGCIHWLTGTRPGTILHEDWKNVGAIDKQDDIIYLPSWGCIDYKGTKLTFWRDLNRAEEEWTAISPEDKKQIHKFFKMVSDFSKIELPLRYPIEKLSMKEALKLGFRVLCFCPSYLSSMKINCHKYAEKFKHPAIRYALTHIQPGNGNLFSMIYSYATVVEGNGGIPKGGSIFMAERMKHRYIELGGSLKVNAKVDHIIVKDNVAVGVALANGESIYGDYIVTAVDPNYVTTRLLFGMYKNKEIEKRYHNPVANPTPSCVLASYEIDMIPNINIPYTFDTEPFKLAGLTMDHIVLRSYHFDPEYFVKDGKTVVNVLLDQYPTEYEYWNTLYKNQPAYQKKKDQVSDMIMSKIIEKFPEFKGHIKPIDVVTPKTLNRYTHCSRGAYMGFLFTSKKGRFSHNGKLKGLKNLYMSGQWLQAPGGLPLALVEGKFAIQRICRKENISMLFKGQYAALKKKKI